MTPSREPSRPPSTQKANSTPKKLGRYKILNEVGRGATAYVYRAYDPQLERYIAVKVLKQALASNLTYREAFLKEARLAAHLTHPGIVTIFDVGIADDKPYIAMELLEGATLEAVLKSQGKLNLRTILAMSQQLARALDYAHQRGVVHRDIKPGNIVVLKDKKTVKLTDFGIAQLDESVSNETAADKVLGTPEYMSPEQVLGQSLDARSDLYSFGVLIYRMLAGLPPFKSDDLGTLFTQIVKSQPPPVLVEEELVKDDMQDLLRKLLHKQPKKRFQRALEVDAELQRISGKIKGEKAGPDRGFISLRLRWTATMAGVVFLAMCISLAIVYFVQYRALSGITFDYGRSIARMLAFESAEPILLEDGVGLNALIVESSQNEQLKAVYVMDLNNLILASTDDQIVGQAFEAPQSRELMQSFADTRLYRRVLENDEVMFDIEQPIVYSDKSLGILYVSFSAESMYLASKTTLITMLIVMMITLLVVFIVTLLLARQTTKDFKRVTQGLAKLAVGRTDARLEDERHDEVGELFASFNRLAKTLENRKDSHGVKPESLRAVSKKLAVSDEKKPVMQETVDLKFENKPPSDN